MLMLCIMSNPLFLRGLMSILYHDMQCSKIKIWDLGLSFELLRHLLLACNIYLKLIH